MNRKHKSVGIALLLAMLIVLLNIGSVFAATVRSREMRLRARATLPLSIRVMLVMLIISMRTRPTALTTATRNTIWRPMIRPRQMKLR